MSKRLVRDLPTPHTGVPSLSIARENLCFLLCGCKSHKSNVTMATTSVRLNSLYLNKCEYISTCAFYNFVYLYCFLFSFFALSVVSLSLGLSGV